MKVLYFHQHFSTPSGSTGVRSYKMARALIDRGCDVTMVCGNYMGGTSGLKTSFRRGVRSGVVDGIHVIETQIQYSNSQSFLSRVISFLRYMIFGIYIVLTQRADIVVCSSTPLTVGWVGVIGKIFRRRKFVFEVRDLWPEFPIQMGIISNPVLIVAMRGMERIIHRHADVGIALSEGMATAMRGLCRPACPISVVPNGSDLDLARECSMRKRPDGVSDTDLMAVYSGTFGVANGLDAIIDAAEILHRSGVENIKFVLIGQGGQKAHLLHRVGAARLSNVIFLDPMEKRSLFGMLKTADVGLQILKDIPAFYDATSPNKFFDYLSCGLPVLVNYPGWVASLLDEYECGLAVSPNDPEMLASRLAGFVSGSPELTAMSHASLAVAKNLFDRDMLAEKWVDSVMVASAER